MVNYRFSIEQPNQQYVRITVDFPVTSGELEIQLPSWRPGRYQLGNFAKNVKGFKVTDDKHKKRVATKLTKDRWLVETEGANTIRVEYQYYAAELNAGSTFLDATQLYVNPVNCCVYAEGLENEVVELTLAIPDDWKIATSMKRNGHVLQAANFEELADSPFMCSAHLQYNQYEAGGTLFHVWFNGEIKPDWKRLIPDFKAFSEKQIEKFTEFPTPEYHFLIHILPIKAYHGVEHSKSTVIALGPSYEVFGELYKELLGVCSHELYHSWNVKAIRPIEMMPYDYTRENYSRLGYLCEGVTTYMGDIFLLKSKVFTEQQYYKELLVRLQTHFDNHARFNYSVADSSFDTWLDGYEPGAPNRKVSIYTEGSLLAFVTDVSILKATNNKHGLDEVMKRLYFNYALHGKGVSEDDYRRELENVSGTSFEKLVTDYINGTSPFESILTEAMEYIGLELEHKPAATYSHARLGLKCLPEGDKVIVKALYPGGPADLAGLMLEDQIFGVNETAIAGELDKWLKYFDDDQKVLHLIRKGKILTLTVPEVNRNFYSEYAIVPVKEPNSHQKKAFEAWKS